MKLFNNYTFLAALFVLQSVNLAAQEGVGIGTSNPQSSLEIVSNDPTRGGLLIPRYDGDDLIGITVPDTQNSMLIYVNSGVTSPTTDVSEFVTEPGYYYYSNVTNKFIKLGSDEQSKLAWTINGNNNATNTSFIGTTTNVPLTIKVNNLKSGYISQYNSGLGYNLLSNISEFDPITNVAGAYGNVAFGNGVLTSLTSGNRNIGLGNESLKNVTTGEDNIALGYNTLAAATLAEDNIGLGQQVMERLEDGRYNIGIGGRVMESAGNGIRQNIGLGYQVLTTVTGNNVGFNIGIGYQALRYGTNASDNVAIGRSTTTMLTNGNSNVAIGRESLENIITGSDNVVIGRATGESLTTGNRNVIVGTQSMQLAPSGDDNIAIGFRAGTNGLTGNGNIIIGNTITTSSPTVSNEVTLGSSTITNYRMWTNGWTSVSDRNLKHSISSLPIGLSFIKQLRPVEYIYNNEISNKKTFGFIAQEVNDVVLKNKIKDAGIVQQFDENTLGLRLNDFIPILTKAIQEQQTVIEKQQEELNTLKKELQEIKKILLSK